MDTAEQYELTKDDIAAMKLADGASFAVYENTGKIRVWLEDSFSRNRIYTVREQTVFSDDRDSFRTDYSRTIPCNWRLSDYGDKRYDPDRQRYECYSSPYGMREHIRTMANCLRVGDVIVLEWLASNNNENQKAIGWHQDELRVKVGNSEGKNVRAFLIDVRVGPNDTARMVKRVYEGSHTMVMD